MASSLPDSLSPDSVDTISELAGILSRLRYAPGAGVSTPSLANFGVPGAAATPAHQPGGVTGTTPLPSATPTGRDVGSSGGGSGAGGPGSGAAREGTSAAGGGGSGGGAASTGPLSVKDIPAETDGLKHKLQQVRAQIRELPDMDRTTEQQESEMAELEARIVKQREVLRALRESGIQFARGDEGPGGGGDDTEMAG